MDGPQRACAVGAVATGATWEEALEGVFSQTGEAIQGADLVLVFAAHGFAAGFGPLLARVRELTASRAIVGCSGQGIIGAAREVEDRPAVALLGLTLPGATVRAAHIGRRHLEAGTTAADWYRLLDIPPEGVNAWLVLADPFTLDAERLVAGLSAAYPGTPIVGGMASGDPRTRGTAVFLGTRVHGEGAVLVALGGAYTVRPVVAQGAAPIGETWTITGVEGNWITAIGGRPAVEVLIETLRGLPPAVQERARTNLLVGLAIDEYRDVFRRGDFLIRNLLGAHRETGALAVSGLPRVGQTIQFQVRDARAADEDLREMLDAAAADLGDTTPVAALLCVCNGRGVGLFGVPDHDARAVAARWGPLPVAGFFCNGEIGPVGGRPYLHGFTASLGLIVPAPTGERRRPTASDE
jgi:small ligand-binding sensory domain FIST